MTIFDFIKEFSIDEMAQFIIKDIERMEWCVSSEEDTCNGGHCIRCIKEWLKQPIG